MGGVGPLNCFPLLTICKRASHTHTRTHTFWHGPGGGVNRLIGGWAISTVESNYFPKGCYKPFFKGGGWLLRVHLRKWDLFPLVKGKVLSLGFDSWNKKVNNGIWTSPLLWDK